MAIKVLRDASPTDGSAQRFDQEIRVVAGLRHPNILPLFDSGTLADGRRFAVMPVAHGRPLRAMISEGPLALADAVRLAREIAEALAFLHTNGWIHRDVKPENVLVESGHAVLTDFGVAAPLQRIGAQSTAAHVARLWDNADMHLTATDSVVGTLSYMCPETLLGDAPIDARVDVYALGLVLYEMLAGDLPFRAKSATALLAERLAHPLPSLRALRPDIPPALDAVIARATSVKAIERFPGTAEFRAALDAISSRPGTDPVELTFRERDRRTMLVAVVLLVSIGSAIGVLRARSASALDPQRIVVADLANETGDRALAPPRSARRRPHHRGAQPGDGAADRQCHGRVRLAAAPAPSGVGHCAGAEYARARVELSRWPPGHRSVLPRQRRARAAGRGDRYPRRADHRRGRTDRRRGRCSRGGAARARGAHRHGREEPERPAGVS